MSGAVPALLFVCTGNICRSPAAELLARDWAERRGRALTASSAGTAGLVGEPVDPAMAEQLRARGVDPSGFAGSRLDAARIGAADVVLCMQRHHVEAVLRLRPAALRRTLLLDHAAALAEAGALPPAADIARADRGAVAAGDWGIPDPYRGGPEDFRAAAGRIDLALGRVLPALVQG